MATFPTVQFLQFDKDVDPSGVRHLLASAIKELDTSLNGELDFGNANTITSGVISNTNMFVFRVDDLADASGVYNMRFYLDSATAFNTGNYRFLYRTETHFQGAGFVLTLADLDIPVTIPTSENLLNTRNEPSLSGVDDEHVSQYVYLAVFVDTNVPFGTYGGAAAGSFRYRMVYDFS